MRLPQMSGEPSGVSLRIGPSWFVPWMVRKESAMNESLTDLGLALVCETCQSEIDFPDEVASEVGICRQCGIAFLVGRLAEDSSTENNSGGASA